MTENEIVIRTFVSSYLNKSFEGKNFCSKMCPIHCEGPKDKKKCIDKISNWYIEIRKLT